MQADLARGCAHDALLQHGPVSSPLPTRAKAKADGSPAPDKWHTSGASPLARDSPAEDAARGVGRAVGAHGKATGRPVLFVEEKPRSALQGDDTPFEVAGRVPAGFG
jgi:hypothetical protein